MRAVFCGSGLDLTLGLKDKEEGNRDRRLECRLPEWKKAKIILHIVDEVKERECQEKRGFHIKAKPRGVGPEYKEQYDIYLSQEIFDELTNPEEDPVTRGGYFMSRCLYDRVDIKYFGV